MNNVSVWWHVVGAALIILILILVPDQHQCIRLCVQRAVQQLRLRRWQHQRDDVLVPRVPFGFLLTQYTITGFDASAHLSEETESASKAAAKGIWQSIFYSAVGGYILLLACCSRSRTPQGVTDDVNVGVLGVRRDLRAGPGRELGNVRARSISAFGQFFCTTSCMT